MRLSKAEISALEGRTLLHSADTPISTIVVEWLYYRRTVVSDTEMMQQTATASTVPGDLNSPRAKLVYLYLSAHDGATIQELGQNLGMKKISLYSILKTLREQEFVEQETDRYVLTGSHA